MILQALTSLFTFSLFAIVRAFSDFIGTIFGLGTTNSLSFDFNEHVGSNPWSSFRRTGSYLVYLDDQEAVFSISDGGKASIIANVFSFYYGRNDWVAKVASGPVITSFKLSAAKSGTDLLVAGEKLDHFTATFNGTYDEKGDIINVEQDLSQDFHVYSIIWTEKELQWLVDNITYKTLEKPSLTNQIDVSNRSTTSDAVNFMIETTESISNTSSSRAAEIQFITVKDYTGAKYYEYSETSHQLHQNH